MANQQAMLEDVEKGGEVLLLADGRRLVVCPDDRTVVSIWLPPCSLILRRGKNAAYPVSVTNDETGEAITAKAA